MAGPVARDIIEAIRARRIPYSPFRDISIRFYGGVPGTDVSALMTQISADGFMNIIFPQGAWVISSLPTLAAGVNITTEPGATFSGTGAALLGLATTAVIVSNQISDTNPPVTGELATFNIVRLPHYTGGPAGVNAGLRVQTNVGANVTNFEWAIIGIVNNSATGGQNVGIYGQGNKLTGAGPTWGGVIQAIDKSGASNPTTGLIGLEVNCDCDGTDNTGTGRRVGIDVVCHNFSGIAHVVRYGIRVHTDGFAGSSITNGLYFDQVVTTGINIATAAGSVVGVDISGATLSAAALRLAASQFIGFTATDTRQLAYIGGNTSLTYTVSGTDMAWITDTGTIRVAPSTALPAGGSTGVGFQLFQSAGLGIYAGSGAPTISAAKGSLYIRSNGTGTTDRAYIATDAVGTWTAITTVA